MLPVRIASLVGVLVLSLCSLASAAPEVNGPSPPSFGALNYAVLVAYLAALVVMGVYFSRREKSTDDYFLAGRRIPWWAAGLSIFGTALSAVTFMAIPGRAYATNWVLILASLSPILLVPLVAWVYIPFFRRLKVTTAYEYLEKRFNAPVRLLGSAQWMLFQFGRMGIVLYLPALALAAVTGMNLYACILIVGVLCTLYTVLGGIEAVIWTDVLQVVVLMGGAILSLLLIAGAVEGGFGRIISDARAAGKFHACNWTWDFTSTVSAVWVVALGGMINSFAIYMSDQQLVQRYLSTRSSAQAQRAIWTSAIMGIPTAVLFFGLGTALFVFYTHHPGLLDKGVTGDKILPFFIIRQMPGGISGLVIAGIFAASMSSVDSSMNAVASVLTTDFYRRFRPNLPEKRYLLFARLVTVVLGVAAMCVAVLVASLRIGSLLGLFLTVVGMFTGGLAGVFLLGIFTRRATGWGALLGALASASVVLATWQLTPVHGLLYGTIALAVYVSVGYVASLALPRGRKDLAGLTVYTKPSEGGQ